MLGWISNSMLRRVSRSCHDELELFVRGLRGGSHEDMAELAMTVAELRLRLTNPVLTTNAGTPSALLRPFPPSEEDAAEAAIFLNGVIQQLQKAGHHASAAGWMVLLHSYRAFVHAEVRYLARQMWGELSRGFGCCHLSSLAAVLPTEQFDLVRAKATECPAGLEPLDQ